MDTEETSKKSYCCSHCGQEFHYQPVTCVQLPYFPAILDTAADGDGSCRVDEWAYTCSERCAWLDAFRRHRAWGMTEEEAKPHLIIEHGLTLRE